MNIFFNQTQSLTPEQNERGKAQMGGNHIGKFNKKNIKFRYTRMFSRLSLQEFRISETNEQVVIQGSELTIKMKTGYLE